MGAVVVELLSFAKDLGTGKHLGSILSTFEVLSTFSEVFGTAQALTDGCEADAAM